MSSEELLSKQFLWVSFKSFWRLSVPAEWVSEVWKNISLSCKMCSKTEEAGGENWGLSGWKGSGIKSGFAIILSLAVLLWNQPNMMTTTWSKIQMLRIPTLVCRKYLLTGRWWWWNDILVLLPLPPHLLQGFLRGWKEVTFKLMKMKGNRRIWSHISSEPIICMAPLQTSSEQWYYV